MVNLNLLESNRRQCSDFYISARDALSRGARNKAEKYVEYAAVSCKFVINNSPDSVERAQYRKFLDKIQSLLVCKEPNDSDNSKDTSQASSSDEPEFVFRAEKRPETRWSDVVGQDKAIHELKKKGVYPMREPQLAKQYNAEYGGLIILFGPPGTGKTLLARAYAGETGSDFYYVKGSDFRDMYVGNTEKKIAQLFKTAEKGRSVIFIDEGDTVFVKRGAGEHSAQEVNEFLQHLDGLRGKTQVLVLTACNQPWLIDPAIISRGKLIYVALPDKDDRAQILLRCLPGDKLASDVNIEELAAMTEHYSGRNLSEACADAKGEAFCSAVEAKMAGDNSAKKITRENLIQALKAHKPIYNERDMERYKQYINAD